MKNTHDLILDYLQLNPAASAAELSRALHLTSADIRYHLKLLQDQRAIEKVAFRQSARKGRPTQLFRLAIRSQLNNYAELADVLLSNQAGEKENSIDQLVSYLVSEIAVAKQRTAQLNRLISFLNERGYQSRWEAYVNGPRILFRNCPYAVILPKHPELCAMDVGIISSYLNLPFQQTAKIDLEQSTVQACIFLTRHQPRG
jgi:predicted ArsR family transcriptional regulator